MSHVPSESSTRHSSDDSVLTAVKEPYQANVRPRLQLQIPGGSIGGSISTPPPTVQTRRPTLTNIATDTVDSQQAPPGSGITPLESRQEPTSERLDSTMRLPSHAGLADSLHQESFQPLIEESPSDGQYSTNRQDYSGVIGGGDAFQHAGTPGSIRLSLSQMIPIRSERSSNIDSSVDYTAGRAIPMQGLDLAIDDLSQAVQSPTLNSPRFPAQRQLGTPSNAQPGQLRRLLQNHPRETTHTNSRTWVNPRTQLQAKWAEVYKSLKEMSFIKESPPSPTRPPFVIGGSFCVPKSLNEWVDHRTGFANDRAREAKQRLWAMQEHKMIPRHPDLPPAGEIAPITILPFGGRRFGDGRSAVLALPTVWSSWKVDERREREPPEEEERPQALWPTLEEMREEGNERNTSHFRRFLALPRVPGNPTVNWKQKKVLSMLAFDEIWKLPSKETYHDQRAIVSAEDTAQMEILVGQDLLSAIYCDMDEADQEAM